LHHKPQHAKLITSKATRNKTQAMYILQSVSASLDSYGEMPLQIILKTKLKNKYLTTKLNTERLNT